MESYSEYVKKVVKNDDRLYAKYIARPISARLSWIILQKWDSVTPNHITVIDFGIGILSVLLLLIAQTPVDIFVAAVVLFLWSVFDHVDGEVARYKNMKTPTGFFLEITFDYLIVAMVPFGVAFYLFNVFSQTSVLFLGFIDCLVLIVCEFIMANYCWTLYKSSKNVSKTESGLTNDQVENRFNGSSLLVNRYTIQIGKLIARIASVITFSGYMVILFLFLALVDLFVPSFILWNHQVTMMHLFLLPYLFLVPYSFVVLVTQYIALKTRLE
ncbi:MAG: CDP-alcohol phosphatidyltransferase family protein [Candidatus Bathyarchaeota archaeon]|nr:CDP-alcohol phosphatidyltransferase family protein [Candidatus Bathyarchaeum sp.]